MIINLNDRESFKKLINGGIEDFPVHKENQFTIAKDAVFKAELKNVDLLKEYILKRRILIFKYTVCPL